MTQYRFHGINTSAPLIAGIFLLCWSPPSVAQPLARPQSLAGAGKDLQLLQHRSVHDGRWIANVPPQGTCPASRLILDVRGSSIRGTAANPFGIFRVVGSLGARGSGTIRIVEMGGTIRFTGNRFVANYFNICGPRYAVGTRVARPRSNTQRT
jgi:hypothetical protein